MGRPRTDPRTSEEPDFMADPMSDENPHSGGKTFSWGRLVVALLTGLAGCLFIWVATPLNNFVLGNSYIADDYLPPQSV